MKATTTSFLLRPKAWLAPVVVAGLVSVAQAGWEANLPDPISGSSLNDAPYKYVGVLRRGGSTGSASVVKHKRVLLTAAHVLYDENGNPDPLPRWFLRYHGTTAPDPANGTDLYGHRRFDSYVNYLQGGGAPSDKEAFDEDVATLFGFEDMAYGLTAPYATDGTNLLTGYDNKRIVGYPVSLYSTDPESPRPLPANADDKYKMHSSHMVWHRFWKTTGTDDFYRATGQVADVAELVSAPGNSGGPVFVKDGDTYKVAGVLVSGINDHLINAEDDKYSGRSGVRAMSSGVVTGLLDPLEHAGDCNFAVNPAFRYHLASGGNGSVALSVGAGCSWYVSMSFADMQWIHVTSSFTGKGNDTITYELDPNPLATTRSGKINVGGKTFTVYQLGEETVDLRDRGQAWRSLSHDERAPGQNLTINADVYNGGNSGSGVGYRVRYYASTNTIISTGDTYLGQRTMGALGNGNWVSIDKTVTIPSNLGGNYYIGWIIDALDEVGEIDEGNNKVVMEDPVFVKRVDLKDGGDHVNLYSDVFPGHAVHFKGKVTNTGNAPSGTFNMKFFLSPYVEQDFGFSNGGGSTAAEIEAGDLYIGQQNFSVGTNENKQFDFAFVLPTNFLKGTYRVKWAIDGSNQVWETDETNNVVQMQNVLIHVLSTIDLRDRSPIFQGLSATERKAGESVTIYGDVYNGGNLGSGEYKVAFYISSDDTIDPAVDTKLGEKSMPGLFKGDYDALDKTVQLPMSISPGTYTIGWVIDPDGTATNNEGMVVVALGGGSQGPKIELTNNNTVSMNYPKLTITSGTLTIDPGGGGGGGIGGPGDLTGGGSGSDPGDGTIDPGGDPVSGGESGEFRITAIRHEAGNIFIEFPTDASLLYTFESSPNGQQWTGIATVQGTGAPMELSDSRVGHVRMLYRVRIAGKSDGVQRRQ